MEGGGTMARSPRPSRRAKWTGRLRAAVARARALRVCRGSARSNARLRDDPCLLGRPKHPLQRCGSIEDAVRVPKYGSGPEPGYDPLAELSNRGCVLNGATRYDRDGFAGHRAVVYEKRGRYRLSRLRPVRPLAPANSPIPPSSSRNVSSRSSSSASHVDLAPAGDGPAQRYSWVRPRGSRSTRREGGPHRRKAAERQSCEVTIVVQQQRRGGVHGQGMAQQEPLNPVADGRHAGVPLQRLQRVELLGGFHVFRHDG